MSFVCKASYRPSMSCECNFTDLQVFYADYRFRRLYKTIAIVMGLMKITQISQTYRNSLKLFSF